MHFACQDQRATGPHEDRAAETGAAFTGLGRAIGKHGGACTSAKATIAPFTRCAGGRACTRLTASTAAAAKAARAAGPARTADAIAQRVQCCFAKCTTGTAAAATEEFAAVAAVAAVTAIAAYAGQALFRIQLPCDQVCRNEAKFDPVSRRRCRIGRRSCYIRIGIRHAIRNGFGNREGNFGGLERDVAHKRRIGGQTVAAIAAFATDPARAIGGVGAGQAILTVRSVAFGEIRVAAVISAGACRCDTCHIAPVHAAAKGAVADETNARRVAGDGVGQRDLARHGIDGGDRGAGGHACAFDNLPDLDISDTGFNGRGVAADRHIVGIEEVDRRRDRLAQGDTITIDCRDGGACGDAGAEHLIADCQPGIRTGRKDGVGPHFGARLRRIEAQRAGGEARRKCDRAGAAIHSGDGDACRVQCGGAGHLHTRFKCRRHAVCAVIERAAGFCVGGPGQDRRRIDVESIQISQSDSLVDLDGSDVAAAVAVDCRDLGSRRHAAADDLLSDAESARRTGGEILGRKQGRALGINAVGVGGRRFVRRIGRGSHEVIDVETVGKAEASARDAGHSIGDSRAA